MVQSTENGNGWKVNLLRINGRLSIPIPVGLELDGTSVLVRKEGENLIITPIQKKTISEFLNKLEPLGPEDEFPDIDVGLLPPKDIDL